MKTTAEQIQGLKEERAAKIASLKPLEEVISTRVFNEAEQTQFDTLKKEITDFAKRIVVLEEKEVRERSESGAPSYPGAGSEGGDTDEAAKLERRKMLKRFSWKRSFKHVLDGRKDGVEGEFDKEERKNMMEAGVSDINQRSLLVPAEAFEPKQKRDMTATGTTTVSLDQGGITIQTNVEGMVDVFLPEMVFGKVPVLRMNGLKGNVRFPQAQTLPSAGWNTENGTAVEKSPLINSLTLSPKRLAAYIQLSNQLLIQSEENVSRYARRFLVSASAIEFEKVALVGGGSNEPTGIIGGTGYTTIYAGGAATNATNATGAQPVWADMVHHISQAKGVNAPDGQAYITSPQMKGFLQITGRQSGGVEGNFILRDWNSGVNGYPMYSTTNLPDTFTKGGTVVLSAIIFGDYSNFVMASWGGMEIGVDPYTNMKEGMTNIVLNSYLDCGMLNPKAFTVGKDYKAY